MDILKKPSNIATLVLISAFVISAGIVFADSVSTSVTVGNATPSVGTVTINGSSAIVLNENTTKTATTTATVSDSNGCSEISAVLMDFYRSGVTAGSCDTGGEADNNSCYPQVICTEVASGNTCDGGVDTSVDYECAVDLQYYADPTDSGSFSVQTWEATISVGDGTATSTGTDNEELNTLQALNVTSSIGYGALSAGADTGTTNSTTTVTNTGNVEIDPELSGTNMASGGDTIPVGSQEYAAAPFTWGAGTDLTTSGVALNITLPQGTSGTVPVTDDVSWGIGIPGGTPSGSYTGTNTVTAGTAQ